MIQNTRIRLFGNVNGYLDTDETTVVPLTFSIAEIKDLSKRKGTFSKSIKIPGTKNNNILLNNYFDVNIQAGTFDINKKVTCAIIQNGITILDNAVMQLVSVEKSQNTLRENDSHTYTVLIKDTTSDLFSIISNKKLEDLELNFLSHPYTANNVIDSFDNTVADGFKYVMPYNPLVVDDIYFNLNEFTPAIYAKKYFDAIFAEAGYSYNWPSMNDIDINFDKLLIPYNGDAKKDISIEDPTLSVSGLRTTAYTQSTVYSGFFNDANYNGIKPSNQQLCLIPETSDPSNLYNSFVYTTPNYPSLTNNTKFKIKVEYEIKVRNTSNQTRKLLSSNIANLRLNIIPTMTIQRLIGNAPGIWDPTFANLNMSNLSGNGNLTLPVNYIIGGNSTTTIQTATADMEYVVNGIQANSKYQFSTKLDINPNSSFSYMYWADTGNAARRGDVFIDMVVKNISFTIDTSLNGELGYNVSYNPKIFVPKNIKQSDYLKSIFTMFNLYAEVDKDKPTQLNIFKRNEYYDSGAEKNWTDKLVKDKPQEIKFLPEISKKKLILTYKEDKDWANEQYKNNVGEVYGQATFTFDNEYVQDTEKIEVIFSPTPVKNSPSLNAVLPMLEGQAPKTNIRILYDGGQQTCNTYSIFNYATTEYTAPAMITSNKYPLITHWDKASNPTFDLNFLPPDYYYRTDNFGSNTANGLFNLHWRRTMNQINTGRLMTAYFYLNEIDIFNLRLNDKIRIDNAWWNINKISDYNANSFEPTKVELISIDDELAIEFIDLDTTGIQQTSPILIGLNDWVTQGIRNKNEIYSEGLVEIAGINNTVGYQSSFVYGSGNNNSINGNSLVLGSNNIANGNTFMLGSGNQSTGNNNSLILGNNNTIDENSASNIIIVGNNITGASQSNTIYSDNLVISSGGTINGISISAVTNDTYVTGATFNTTTGTLSINQNNSGPTINVTGFNNNLTGYVTTNTSQAITGYKEFTNIGYLVKVNTAVNPTQSGGNFILGNTNGGSGYDRFNFYSLDGTDSDSFGIVSIYSNPEEGNYIGHSSLDFTNDARLSVNQYNYNLQHIVSGQRTALYIDGTVDKIKIEGTENKFAALGTSLITGTKNFEFPNQSGTLALLSDITGSTGTDIRVTGGTYNNTTGIATFTNNTGGTFNVTGFTTGYTLTSGAITSALGYTPVSADTFVNTFGYSPTTNTLTIGNSTGGTLTAQINTVSGLTVTNKLFMTNLPASGTTTDKILVRNATNGEIKYLSVASLPSGGGSNLWEAGSASNSIQSVRASAPFNVASGIDSIVWGAGNTAAGDTSQASGFNTLAFGALSIARGEECSANAAVSEAGGRFTKTTHYNEWARGGIIQNGTTANIRLGMYGFANWVGTTGGSALTRLYLDNDGFNNNFTLDTANSVYGFEITVLAVNKTTLATKYWVITGVVKCLAGATSFVGTPTTTVIAQDTAMTSAGVSVIADNTNDIIYPEVLGIASQTIDWNCVIRYNCIVKQ